VAGIRCPVQDSPEADHGVRHQVRHQPRPLHHQRQVDGQQHHFQRQARNLRRRLAVLLGEPRLHFLTALLLGERHLRLLHQLQHQRQTAHHHGVVLRRAVLLPVLDRIPGAEALEILNLPALAGASTTTLCLQENGHPHRLLHLNLAPIVVALTQQVPEPGQPRLVLAVPGSQMPYKK